ncbi:DUF397 domain-containing protein [Glycomyces sp. NPDC047369]
MHTTPWRKSSRSNNSGDGANCVETRWRKSSMSSGNGSTNCVEARAHCNVFDVRDSKFGDDSPVFTVEAEDFAALLRTCVATADV